MADDIPSGAGMTLLATAIANFLAEDLTVEEMNTLGNFLTVVCSCLFLLAAVTPSTGTSNNVPQTSEEEQSGHAIDHGQ